MILADGGAARSSTEQQQDNWFSKGLISQSIDLLYAIALVGCLGCVWGVSGVSEVYLVYPGT